MTIPPFRCIAKSLGSEPAALLQQDTVELPQALFRALLRSALAESEFDEAAYRDFHSDVRDAIHSGNIASGLEHYAKHGYFEGRRTFSEQIDEDFYLSTQPDVAKAIDEGAFKSAHDHFARFGAYELRAPNEADVPLYDYWKSVLRVTAEPEDQASAKRKK